MIRILSVVIVLVLLCIGCYSIKRTASRTPATVSDVSFIAWNEDTVNSYRFVLAGNQQFEYLIFHQGAMKDTLQYRGVVAKASGDTLFLNYSDDRMPADCKKYLVIEGSGQYIIQYFENKDQPVFMRKQRVRPVL